jgi:hypothetical protein
VFAFYVRFLVLGSRFGSAFGVPVPGSSRVATHSSGWRSNGTTRTQNQNREPNPEPEHGTERKR